MQGLVGWPLVARLGCLKWTLALALALASELTGIEAGLLSQIVLNINMWLAIPTLAPLTLLFDNIV